VFVTDSCWLTYVHTEDIAVIVVLMTLGLPYIYFLEDREDPECTNTKNSYHAGMHKCWCNWASLYADVFCM